MAQTPGWLARSMSALLEHQGACATLLQCRWECRELQMSIRRGRDIFFPLQVLDQSSVGRGLGQKLGFG